MVLNATNEQLDRFITAYKKAHGIREGTHADIFAAAKEVSLKIPSKDHPAANRHLIALFDRTGRDAAHWKLIESQLARFDETHRVDYLAKLARDPAYSPKEIIPYDEFLELSNHAYHEIHSTKPRRIK